MANKYKEIKKKKKKTTVGMIKTKESTIKPVRKKYKEMLKRKKLKRKTAYEKRMDARKKGETNKKKMAKREKTLRELKRFDPSLKGTDRGGYPKQYGQRGRKKSREWMKKYVR